MDCRVTVLSGFLLLFVLAGFCQGVVEPERAFVKDELLKYKLYYGWFAVGRGSFEIKDAVENYNGKPCYEVLARGKSSGLLNWIAPVQDEWGSFIDVTSLLPRYTFRNLNEGRYQLREEVFIDLDQGVLRVESIKPHRKVPLRPMKHFEFDPKVPLHDLMSGLLAIRNINFDHLSKGDTVELRAFFEDTFYDFQIVFEGREELKTRFGHLGALKVIPLMPENSVFDGDRALVAWLSDDGNKLPLKVAARMSVGKVSAELIDYQNIKYGLLSK